MTENSYIRRSSMRTRGFGASPANKLLRKLDALEKGKTIVETVENPDRNKTNMRFIRVRRNTKAVKR
ncbi:MAG: hypothetical protein ACI9O0_000731 [Paracoccaceae bacterium]|jgi:hypothetical protein